MQRQEPFNMTKCVELQLSFLSCPGMGHRPISISSRPSHMLTRIPALGDHDRGVMSCKSDCMNADERFRKNSLKKYFTHHISKKDN